jgi:arsenate reductase-like glutaredoxin family protein
MTIIEGKFHEYRQCSPDDEELKKLNNKLDNEIRNAQFQQIQNRKRFFSGHVRK